MKFSGLAALVLWLSIVFSGMSALWGYETTPGEPGAPPASWPVDSVVPRPSGRPTLVMAVHPRCPCSRASLEELDRLMARLQGRVSVFVLFYAPAGTMGWEKTDLWRSAAAIPGVVALRDADSREATRLGALTSGHVLLYGAEGRLLFSGGITSSRGHAGWSEGADAVYSLVVDGVARTRRTDAYGCALVARNESGSWAR